MALVSKAWYINCVAKIGAGLKFCQGLLIFPNFKGKSWLSGNYRELKAFLFKFLKYKEMISTGPKPGGALPSLSHFILQKMTF